MAKRKSNEAVEEVGRSEQYGESPAEREASRDIIRQAMEAKKAEDQKLRELFSAYSALAFSQSGQIVIAHLKAETENISYQPGRDAAEVAFHEGRRSIVRDILANIQNGRMVVEMGDLERSDLQQYAEQEEIFIP